MPIGSVGGDQGAGGTGRAQAATMDALRQRPIHGAALCLFPAESMSPTECIIRPPGIRTRAICADLRHNGAKKVREDEMAQLAQSYVHGASTVPLIGETIGVYFDKAAERWAGRPA